MICVFDKGNTNYTGNGNAVLVPTECKLHNVAGGNYDLTMSHPMDPEGKWKHLVPGAVIRCPVPEEEIPNAYAGYDVDVYKTNVKAELREGPSEPTVINYPVWGQTSIEVGTKVTYNGKNYECTYWDPTSRNASYSPDSNSWFKEIPRYTQGSPSLVTLPAGAELYDVESYDTTWEKMSTFYGIVGYIKKSQVTYDRHLTPSETKPRIITEQLFRIEKPTVDTKNRSVSVTAKHVSYDLSGVLIQDVKIAQASPAMALSRIADAFMIPYAGTVATNLDAEENGTYTQEIKGKNGMFALLDPDKGIVSTFRAEFRRDNWDLFVMTQENTDRGFRLKYRKNLLGVNWAQDSGGIITRVVPVAKDAGGNDLYLPEKWIDSDDISNYPVIKMEQLTVKGQVGKDKGTGDGSTWTQSDLLDEMRTKAEERFTVNKADKVSVTVTVDFEQLGATEEYQALKGLESVLLYDTVTVLNDEIGLSLQLYVSEMEWDAIRRKVVSLKLVNAMGYSKGNVTGYNVQAKSIGSDKLSDDVSNGILDQVRDIIPEYSDPQASRPATVTVSDSDPTLAWGTRSKVGSVAGTDLHVTLPANPDTWRPVVDNLTSTDTDKSLSANQGRVLYGMFNSYREVPFSITVSDWSASGNWFVANYNTAYVTSSSKDKVFLDSSAEKYGASDVITEKKSGGGGIKFTAKSKPTGTISGTICILDTNDGKVPVLIEDTVVAIANGGTGQSSLAGAKNALGITALGNSIEALSEEVDKCPVITVLDNVTANESKTYTLPQNDVMLLFASGTSTTRMGIWWILSRSNGSIVLQEIVKGSSLSVTTGSNNALTIANSSNGTVGVRIMIVT